MEQRAPPGATALRLGDPFGGLEYVGLRNTRELSGFGDEFRRRPIDAQRRALVGLEGLPFGALTANLA